MEEIQDEEIKKELNLSIYQKESDILTFRVIPYLYAMELVPIYAYLFHIKHNNKIICSTEIEFDSYIKKKEISKHLGEDLLCVTAKVKNETLFTSCGHFAMSNHKFIAGIFIDELTFKTKSFNKLETKDFIIALDNRIFSEDRFSYVKKYYNKILKTYPKLSVMKVSYLHDLIFHPSRKVDIGEFKNDTTLEEESNLLKQQDGIVKCMLDSYICNTNLTYI